MAENPTSLKKHSLIATVAIMGSRLFGLIREQVFAFFFGASFVQDAFVAAFRIPNLMRDLFAEGALSQSFVTVFSQKLKDSDQKSFALANKVNTFILIVVGILVVLGIIFSSQVVNLIAKGFTGETYQLTVTLTQILFPFILFASLASILMGMLNAKNRFFLPQSASTFFNITSILVGLLTAYFLAPDYISGNPTALSKAIIGMAIGTLIGGLVQWLIQYPTLHKMGFRFKLDFHLRHPDLIQVLKLTGPAIVGGAAVQVNVMVITYFASFLAEGSVAYLNYAFRFMLFPLGVFGVAIALASAPKLARLISENQIEGFITTINSAMKMSLFLSLPSAVGLILLAQPIIALIYEHGHFTVTDTQQTALALIAYSFAISAYSLIKIYQPAYLAFHDAKTPMKISLLSIGTNLFLCWFFVSVMNWQHWALAISVSCVAIINFILLALFFRKKVPGLWNKNVLKNIGKSIVACAFMAITIVGALQICQLFSLTGLNRKLIFVFLPMILASFVYFGVAYLLKSEDAVFFIEGVRRKLKR